MNPAAASTHQRRSTADRRPRRRCFVARLLRGAGFEEREVRGATGNDSAAARTFL
jgi:hypothetical protein